MEKLEVLYIEDDSDVAYVYKEVIEGSFHNIKVDHFQNGEKAIEKLQNDPTKYSLIISDYDLPGLDGGEVFKFVHRQMLGIPFIVLSGFDISLDENFDKLLHAHVRNAQLVKPVVYSELIEKIKWCLEEIKEIERIYMDSPSDNDSVTPIQPSLLMRVNEVPFNVYLKMSKNKKLIKVISENEIYSKNLINKFILKGVKVLYIKKSNIPYLISMVSDQFVFNLRIKKKKLTDIDKQQKVNQGTALIIDGLIKCGFSKSIYNLSKEVIELNCEVIKDLVETNKGLQGFLEKYQISNRSYLDHVHLISFLTTSILHEIGWDSESSINKMSFACLLHDSSLTAHPKLLKKFENNLEGLTGEEKEIYKNHPLESSEIAAKFEKYIPNIKNIILEHHENAEGTGYPNKKSALKIHPLGAILVVANIFAKELHNKDMDDQILFEAFLKVKSEYYKGHYKKALDALENIIRK